MRRFLIPAGLALAVVVSVWAAPAPPASAHGAHPHRPHLGRIARPPHPVAVYERERRIRAVKRRRLSEIRRHQRYGRAPGRRRYRAIRRRW